MRVFAPLVLVLVSGSAFAQAPAATTSVVSRGAAQAVAVYPSAITSQPTGEGEPLAITCRPPQALPGKRIRGPEVCKTNQVWAQYARDGMTVAADGVHDIPSERWRSTNPAACRAATPGGGGTTNMVYSNFSMICE